ncbi:MAG: hypothetical protein K7J15_04265, partial [Candidatus Regiella insecticola]|nr:hypothetical protein [Candidatus Regiella insecticola]
YQEKKIIYYIIEKIYMCDIICVTLKEKNMCYMLNIYIYIYICVIYKKKEHMYHLKKTDVK